MVDFGTAYAKAIVVHFSPAQAWHVVGAGNICYGNRQLPASPVLLPEQRQAATEALQQAQERSLSLCGRRIAPRAIIVSVPADMLTLHTYRWEMKRRHSLSLIDASEAADALSQAHSASLSQAALHERTANPDSQPVWLGTIWAAWFVDEHNVTSAIGFRGATLAVSVTQAITSASAFSSLRSWSSELGVAVVFLPEPLGIAELLRRRQPRLLLDAGAQRTGIYLQCADGQFHYSSIPTGGHYFNRWLSLAGGLSPSRAEKVKLAYAEDHLHHRSSMKVRLIMQRAFAAWAKRLTAALPAVSGALPGTWVIAGGHSRLPEWAILPGIIANASMSRLERYPTLELLSFDDCAGPIVSGPEKLQPCHAVAWGLAQYSVRLSYRAKQAFSSAQYSGQVFKRLGRKALPDEEQALMELRQIATLAAKTGFEVPSEWLT